MKQYLVSVLVILASCSTNTYQIYDPPLLKFPTPESAVTSFWRAGSWNDTTHIDTSDFVFYSSNRLQKERSKILSKLSTYRGGHSYDKNSIVNVRTGSDSLALVRAKTFNEYFNGYDDTRYILVKEGASWRIEDIQILCYSCGGSGLVLDPDQKLIDIQKGLRLTNPKKKCDVCDGTGWRTKFR